MNPGTYKSSFHPRLRWEEFYKTNKNIDVVFLGSSHAYRSFDPNIFDKSLGINSFNMGSSNQNPIDSYFVLKEVIKRHKPRVVVFEQYYVVSSGENTDFTSATYNYDYIKPSLNKLNCLINEFSPMEYPRAIFRSIRYKDNWNKTKIWGENLKRLSDNIVGLITGDKNENIANASETGEIYRGKGYVSNDGIASQKELTINNKFKTYTGFKFNSKKMEYDKKVIQLCKKNHIKLILVTAPYPPSSFKLIKNYDYIHGVYQKLAEDNRILYVDYNYINKQSRIFTDKNFKDSDHLNTSGVKLLDKNFMKYLAPRVSAIK